MRAWQGHKIEKKYFLAVTGSFLICVTKIDNWNNPSKDLKVEKFVLSSKKPQALVIPRGYANGFKALTLNSKLLIFSNLALSDSQKDIFRFDKELWYKWD